MRDVEIDALEPGRFQPRRDFHPESLAELAASIREQGVVQPIVVVARGAKFEIVAGERRWRAARQAGLERVPVVVREAATDRELLEIALVENLQREDLNPLEAAAAYARLKEEFHLTQEDVARRVGKDRATVANSLRLLKLPAAVKRKAARRLDLRGARARAARARYAGRPGGACRGDRPARPFGAADGEADCRAVGPARSSGKRSIAGTPSRATPRRSCRAASGRGCASFAAGAVGASRSPSARRRS